MNESRLASIEQLWVFLDGTVGVEFRPFGGAERYELGAVPISLCRSEGGGARLVNNILVGKGRVLVGPGSLDANVIRGNAGLLDRTRFDYQLCDGSPAIDGGIDAVDLGEIAFPPGFEYRRPLSAAPRRAQGRVDAGAHEYHAADGGN